MLKGKAMHKITNISKGRHQVRTLDQGLVFLDPEGSVEAKIEPSYARLLRHSRVLSIVEAENHVQGGREAVDPKLPHDPPKDSTEHTGNDASKASEPTTRAEWVAYAESLGVEIAKSWGIKRIQQEIEKKNDAS